MKKFFLLSLILIALAIFSSNTEIAYAYSMDEIKLNHENKNFEINLKAFTGCSKIHTIIWQASKFSRNSSNKNKASSILKFYEATGDIENAFEMVLPGIKKEIEKIEKKVNTESINAHLKLENDFKIIKEKNGIVLDKEKLYFEIIKYLNEQHENKIDIPVLKTDAKFKTEDLKNSMNLRASFKTDYSKSSTERKNNIQKAIGSFNGLNIYPGETISFNKTTGERNEKNGYKQAKIIIGGEYVEGFGGGVCQASTTIYNACLRAGLNCTGNCHSIPPSYVGKGLDAMVNTGSSDMTITNNLQHPVYIQAYCTNEKVVVNVYGENMGGYSYKPKVVVNETLPDKGYKKIIDTNGEFADKVLYNDESFIKQSATNGYKTTTYLQTFHNNILVNEKKIRKDFYPASEGIIVFGSKERPAVEEFDFFNFGL